MVRIIAPTFDIEPVDSVKILKKIELAGRVCYKSEERVSDKSYEQFIKRLIDNGHESVLEHVSVTVKIICDRGISHELVRHRMGSYSQESTRYVNYSKDAFDEQITVIDIKPFVKIDNYVDWIEVMKLAEKNYMEMLYSGVSPQIARSVLPNSLKTEIICTKNLRGWRDFLKLRTTKSAHPQMRQITIPLLNEFKKVIPIVFDDIEGDEQNE